MKSRKMIAMISLMVIVVIIMEILLSNTVWASSGFFGSVRSEAPKSPASTPGDAPQTSIPSTPSTPSTPVEPTPRDPNAVEYETVYVDYVAWFEGYVKENLGYSDGYGNADGSCEDSQINTIGIKDALINISGSGTGSKRTDDNGYYKIQPSPGTYSIGVQYGKISNDIDMNDADRVRNILKYNGQDYKTVDTPVAQNHEGVEHSDTSVSYTSATTSEEMEIIQGGKGVTQLMIMLDCSDSMRSNPKNSDNKRLNVAVKAAKELCSSVINGSENIYVGLVFYSGTCYRAVSLTRDLNKLNLALDNDDTSKGPLGILQNGWNIYDTNMVGAFDKCYNSFINNGENSNRYITVISDGIPTSDGNVETYQEDSDEELWQKLNYISEKTINKMEEIKNDGVNIYSIITEPEWEEEEYFVNKIFKEHSTEYKSVKDGDNASKTINTILRDYLIEHKKTTTYRDSSYTITAGYDDENRFNEVFGNFSEPFTYSNSEMFKQIEGTEAIDASKAQELSDKTYMNVSAGSVTIESPPAKHTEKTFQIDPDTGKEIYVKYTTYIPKPVGVQIGDVVLARRPVFSLGTKITATGLRIVLANGQVLTTNTVNPGVNNSVKVDLDNDLAHSATVQLEYTIDIVNDSPIVCEHVELVSSLPKDLIYDENINLISENKSNKDIGWNVITDLSELRNQNLITQETLDNHKNYKEIKVTLDNGGQGENGFNITPGGDYPVRFVVSRMIGNIDNISDILANKNAIDAEILAYQNQAHRRMVFFKDESSSDVIGIYPGDSKDKDYSDTSTNTAAIIPPTGKQEISIIKKIKNDIKLILPLDEIKKILKAMGIK